MTTAVHDPAPPFTTTDQGRAKREPTVVEVTASRFPRVNLLPASVRASTRLRHARLIVMAVAGVAVVATFGLYALALMDMSGAQNDYDTAVARGDALKREATKYAEVPVVTGKYQAAAQQRATAMAGEVRWSVVMTNVAAVLPPGIRLTELNGALATASAGAAGTAKPAAPPGSAAAAAAAAGDAGTLQFSGVSTTVPAVARWLDVLAAQKLYRSPYATTVQRPQGTQDGPAGLEFDGSASVAPAALSHRFDADTTSKGTGSR